MSPTSASTALVFNRRHGTFVSPIKAVWYIFNINRLRRPLFKKQPILFKNKTEIITYHPQKYYLSGRLSSWFWLCRLVISIFDLNSLNVKSANWFNSNVVFPLVFNENFIQFRKKFIKLTVKPTNIVHSEQWRVCDYSNRCRIVWPFRPPCRFFHTFSSILFNKTNN